MNLELAGIVAAGIGVLLLNTSVYWTALFMVLATVFGAAAAISLPALGGASILVPNLFLMFFAVRILLASGEGPVFSAVIPWRPGFWLLILTLFGIITALFLPRLFAGMTETMSVTRSVGDKNFLSLIALRPTSNNITQSVYALGGLICFVFAFAYGRQHASPKEMTKIFVIVGSINILFAVIDVITFYSGTEYLMDSIRSANYRLLTGSEKAGLKRISGTFAEASAFANYSLALFAITASLWLDRSPNRNAGPVAFLLLITLLLSTSATALVGIVAVTYFLGCRSLITALQHPHRGRQIFIVVSACLPIIAIITIPALAPSIAEEIRAFLDEILFSKAQSRSGLERLEWNASAYQTFLDTFGFGAGLGSARASSYPLVLLSNIGVIGTALFAIFAGSIIFAKTGWSTANTETALDQARVARATKAGFLSVLLTSFVSGTVYDLGLLFYFAGGICAAFCLKPSVKPISRSNVDVTKTRERLLPAAHNQSNPSS